MPSPVEQTTTQPIIKTTKQQTSQIALEIRQKSIFFLYAFPHQPPPTPENSRMIHHRPVPEVLDSESPLPTYTAHTISYP